MAPNLLVLVKNLLRPRCWGISSRRHRRRRSASPSNQHPNHESRRNSYQYTYVPERGWFLAQRNPSSSTTSEEDPLVWCTVLRRWMPKAAVNERRKWAEVTLDDGRVSKRKFLRLDDGVTWVDCWADDGTVKTGPWRRWCIDDQTGEMRPMLKRDDPNWKGKAVDASQRVERQIPEDVRGGL
ncbi:MAG: hypothetical protein M1823_000337 [Watsoniomyces obsoletus]|nr:MAG: hypothetical protein M1823_000337 [Watsoniomyces obsoletus]